VFLIEMNFWFFSLMKRTKNQGCGIAVKAQFSDVVGDFRFESLLKS
jgi:hypothetical protein